MSDLVVDAGGVAVWNGVRIRAAIGRNGTTVKKREGDGKTPVGCFAMRRVLYRPDRLAAPRTALRALPLDPADGWCDDPDDGAYNLPVRLPYGARVEALWRADGIYDLIVVLGYNDAPVEPGAGSAIFLHLAASDWRPTAGCVALGRDDLVRILGEARADSRVIVTA